MAFDPNEHERKLRIHAALEHPFPPAPEDLEAMARHPLFTVPDTPIVPDNVVALENRKSKWTPAECLAVAGRRPDVKRLVVGLETASGDVAVMCSDMNRKDMLWLAEQIRAAALCPAT